MALQPLLLTGHAVSVEVGGSDLHFSAHSSPPEPSPLVRRATKLHDPSSRNAETPVTMPMRAAPQERRKHLIVPGHLALPAISEVHSAGGNTLGPCAHCEETYAKANAIAAALKTALTATDDQADMAKLETLLAARTQCGQALPAAGAESCELESLWSKATAMMPDHQIAIQTAGAKYWLDRDDCIWAKCLYNQACSTATDCLEETANGITIQGDIAEATAGGAGGGLLEQTAMFIEAAAHHRRFVDNTWPKTGTTEHEIPYCFASDVSTKARTAINDAILHVEQQVGCIKFKATEAKAGVNKFADAVQENCDPKETASIIFQTSKAGCWSLVGQHSNVVYESSAPYAGSSQPVNIGTNCEQMGIAAHEIGHALGMLHEMSRDDREQYLKVMMENVPEDAHINFKNDTRADQGSEFDFLSLMMYGAYAFSANDAITLEPNDKRLVNYMGQRMGFSQLDVELIGKMYKCENQVTPKTLNAALSMAYLTPGGITSSFSGECKDAESKDTGFNTPGTDSPMPCSDLKKHCAHDTLGSKVQAACPVSCFVCQPGIDNQVVDLPPTAGSASNTSNYQHQLQGAARSQVLVHGAVLISMLLLAL